MEEVGTKLVIHLSLDMGEVDDGRWREGGPGIGVEMGWDLERSDPLLALSTEAVRAGVEMGSGLT